MRDFERAFIERIESALVAIPLPAGATQSMTVAGACAYASDMRFALPLLCRALLAAKVQGITGWESDVEWGTEALEELEKWILKRQREDWKPC